MINFAVDLFSTLWVWHLAGVLVRVLRSTGSISTWRVVFNVVTDVIEDYRALDTSEARFAYVTSLKRHHRAFRAEWQTESIQYMSDDELESRILSMNDGHLL